MIKQYLPQINESTTVAKSKKFSHLNNTICCFYPGCSFLTELLPELVSFVYIYYSTTYTRVRLLKTGLLVTTILHYRIIVASIYVQ